MEVSLGFFVLLFLVLFPGLIYRRLYYYGEFSKEFKDGKNLLHLLAVSSVPGFIILFLTFFSFDFIFMEIDIDYIIDKLKDLNSPEIRLTGSEKTPLKSIINSKVAPFVGFQYLISIIAGSLSGRIIRISRLDTRLKLLRFKNYWFYLLNGQLSDLKKLKHLKESNKKHVFTKADILVNTNGETKLYSGIVVDYELCDGSSNTLSKIMLQNAGRYSLIDQKRTLVQVPGTLFVVDCTSMVNINLTYIYEDTNDILKSKIPNNVEVIFGLLIILLIPIFLFKSESINFDFYRYYFNLNWFAKLLAYFSTIQFLSLLNPFVKHNTEYKFITVREILGKLVWLIIMLSIIYFFG